ncbi:MAG: TIGR02996 domain-containing protein, partial [Planctomycetales bacterium]|nr:TIGR02996 domain-containing protein [Planctomycetales bacterium]
MTDNPFLQQVVENPDDDAARLVYADYLEEQGDPRSEFIRVQCELARTSPLDPGYEDLSLRSEDLLDEHRDTWVGGLAPDVKKAVFERGFIA